MSHSESNGRLDKQAAELAAQTAGINAQVMRIDAFEKQVAEMAMLKQQMTALLAGVSAAGRLNAPGLADGITWLHRQGCVRAPCGEAELQRREICVRRDCQSRRDRR